MGVYYIIVNHSKKQFIDPGNVNDGPIKLPSIAMSKTANVLCLALTWAGPWEGDAIGFLGDGDDYYYDIQDTYEDVTEALVNNYNHWCTGDTIEYTGKR